MVSEEWSDYEEGDEIPLQHKRPFGSGLKRKQVVFVPASTGNLNSTESEPKASEPSKSVSNVYLSIVLPKEAKEGASTDETNTTGPDLCDICKLPVNVNSGTAGTGKSGRPHEASIAHQVCVSHSHPPSAIDRSRMGLGVLQAQGWDPDARTGLGALNQGISFPIKAGPKNDTLGLGVEVPKDMDVKRKEKPRMLDAKKVRKMAAKDKRRHEKLRQQLFGNPDVERYLGTG